MKKKLLKLPVEVFKREYLSRLYLALKSADKGFQVIIGEDYEKVFSDNKGGVYLYKDFAGVSEERLMKQAKDGAVIAAFDEEGIIYLNEDVYLRNRVSSGLIKELDFVFLWGGSQKKTIQRKVDNDSNLFVTGSIKFDIYNLINKRKKRQDNNESFFFNKKIKILINTRFTFVNSLFENNGIQNLKKLGVIKDENDLKIYQQMISSDYLIYKEFLKLIDCLGKDSSFEVVIRAHPAENFNAYAKFSEKYDNVSVDLQTDLITQITSADFVIHDGCTTAIEARALGVSVLGLRPKGLTGAYMDYANKYSLNFQSYNDLKNFLDSFKKNAPIDSIKMPVVDDFVHDRVSNWGESRATNSIVETFSSCNVDPVNIVHSQINFIDLFFNRLIRFVMRYKDYRLMKIADFFLKYRLRDGIESRQRRDYKFPNFNLESVTKDIDFLYTLDSDLPCRNSLVVEKLTEKSIIIYCK